MEKGRYAPSPSGRMHLGNLFSAMLAWCSARSKGGEFILRMEDIDERSKNPEYQDLIKYDLSWLGIDWDGDPIVQSGRGEAYEQAIGIVSKEARLYPCFCTRAELHASSAPHASDGTPIYSGACKALSQEEVKRRAATRPPALRIEVPYVDIDFIDGNYGFQSQNLQLECGDFLLKRSDGNYAYQLAVVVDDAASGVTQVVRGSDLLSSTPRQIWLYKLLDQDAPRYFHHPVLLAPDGKRLSKRQKSLDAGMLQEAFKQPERLVGWIGWLAGQIDAPEPLKASELSSLFSWDKVPTEDIYVQPFGPIERIA